MTTNRPSPHCLYDHHEWRAGGIALAGTWFNTSTEDRPDMHSSQSGGPADPAEEYHKLADGAAFIDKRPVKGDALSHGVVSGPMLRAYLPPGTVVRWPDREPVPVPDGYELRGFDSVAADVYAAYWATRGARIGRREGPVMVWSDGEREEIAPCRCWHHVCLGCGCLRHYVDREPGGYAARTRKPASPTDHCPACRAKGK